MNGRCGGEPAVLQRVGVSLIVMYRSETWGHIKRGDVVLNTAVGDFGNEGKLIHDGKYLRDLQYVYDAVGHVPVRLFPCSIHPRGLIKNYSLGSTCSLSHRRSTTTLSPLRHRIPLSTST